MRGTQLLCWKKRKITRITPAHAGNTKATKWFVQTGEDHPRPCGEHKRSLKEKKILTGSPPPMRGTQDIIQGNYALSRITPAHAGNTADSVR